MYEPVCVAIRRPASSCSERGPALLLSHDARVHADLGLGDEPGGLPRAAGDERGRVAVRGEVELAGDERLVEVGAVGEASAP